MQASHWQEVQKLFDASLRLPPDERTSFLARACGDDQSLLSAVTTMLDRHQQSSAGGAGSTITSNKVIPSLIGKTVGPYYIEARIGVGGMGVVYKAQDTRLNRHIALKCLPLNMVGDKIARERFINEAKAASRLDHPNICGVYDVGELDDGQLYMAIPFYDGNTLADTIKNGTLTHTDAINIIHDVAQGLKVAHQNQIVHRDIKPANIMLTNDGAVKILDFGVAKMAGTDMTGTGVSVGTAAYMSPEQLMGSPVDHRADIWALGAVLYEMLTGKRAFSGENSYAMVYAIINSEPDFALDIPASLLPLLKKSLARNVDDRCVDADEFIHQLFADDELQEQSAQTGHRIPIMNTVKTGWDQNQLDLIAKVFTRYLGPIAIVVVKKEAALTDDLDKLLNTLASKLDNDEQKQKFISRVHKKLQNPNSLSSTTQDMVTEISPQEAARIEEAFRYHVGPIASALLKRAMQRHATYDNLVTALSEKLETDKEKQTFLKKLGLDEKNK